MTGQEFLQRYAGKPLGAWEQGVVEAAARGETVPWPLLPVRIEGPNGEQITFQIASDYLAVGTSEDYVRMPLTPTTAQAVANLKGMMLPTPKLVYETWRQAPIKLGPIPMVPNRGADLEQYAAHSRAIDENLPLGAGLRSGQKKDIVVSSLLKPGKVVIFGWYKPDLEDVFDNRRPMNDPQRQPIQPHSNAHGDFYVDYSHGVRLVGPIAIVDGKEMRTEDVYRDPTLGKIVNHEAHPLTLVRYRSPIPPSPDATRSSKVALADQGLRILVDLKGRAAA